MALIDMNLYQQQHDKNISKYSNNECVLLNRHKDENCLVHVDRYVCQPFNSTHFTPPTAILLLLLLTSTTTSTSTVLLRLLLLSKFV